MYNTPTSRIVYKRIFVRHSAAFLIARAMEGVLRRYTLACRDSPLHLRHRYRRREVASHHSNYEQGRASALCGCRLAEKEPGAKSIRDVYFYSLNVRKLPSKRLEQWIHDSPSHRFTNGSEGPSTLVGINSAVFGPTHNNCVYLAKAQVRLMAVVRPKWLIVRRERCSGQCGTTEAP